MSISRSSVVAFLLASSVASGALAAAATKRPPIQAAPKSGWTYSQDKDAMRGTVTYFARLQSQNSLQFDFPYQGGARGVLIVRHRPEDATKYTSPLSILLHIDKGQLLCSDYNSSNKVAVKFDDGAVEEFRCSEPSFNGSVDTVFIHPDENFLAKLKQSSRVVVEATFFREGRRQLTFRTASLRWEHDYSRPEAIQAAEGLAERTPSTVTPAPSAVTSTSAIALTSQMVTADDYPAISIRLQEQGTVAIRFVINAAGTIDECSVATSSGKTRLDDAACTLAKRRWKFKPATQNGVPVAVSETSNVVFLLR